MANKMTNAGPIKSAYLRQTMATMIRKLDAHEAGDMTDEEVAIEWGHWIKQAMDTRLHAVAMQVTKGEKS